MRVSVFIVASAVMSKAPFEIGVSVGAFLLLMNLLYAYLASISRKC